MFRVSISVKCTPDCIFKDVDVPELAGALVNTRFYLHGVGQIGEMSNLRPSNVMGLTEG